MPDHRGDHVESAGYAQNESGGERTQHLSEDEYRGADDPGRHQRQSDFQHRAEFARAEHPRTFLQRGIHRLHCSGDHHKGDRALEQGHNPGDTQRRVNVEQVAAAAGNVPKLVEKPGLGPCQDAPGHRADQGGHIIRQFHQPFQFRPAGDIGSAQDPRQHEAHRHGHHRCQGGDQQSVADDTDIVDNGGEVMEAERFRWKHAGLAGIERFRDQKDDRIDHEGGAEQQHQHHQQAADPKLCADGSRAPPKAEFHGYWFRERGFHPARFNGSRLPCPIPCRTGRGSPGNPASRWDRAA